MHKGSYNTYSLGTYHPALFWFKHQIEESWTFAKCCLPVGHVVHEEQSAGSFVAGHAKHPVATLPEDDLKLLRSRSEMESPHTPREVPATPSAKPGDRDGQNQVEPTQQDEVQSPATTVAGEPSPKTGTGMPAPEPPTGMPPPQPPTSSSSKRAQSEPQPKSSKPKIYDKYKDGSYWKILGLFI